MKQFIYRKSKRRLDGKRVRGIGVPVIWVHSDDRNEDNIFNCR